jgi:hypothetical protein
VADQDPADGDGARLKAKAEKFGAGYAAFSEGFSGAGLDRLVGAVKVCLAAAVVFVIGAAIWSRF